MYKIKNNFKDVYLFSVKNKIVIRIKDSGLFFYDETLRLITKCKEIYGEYISFNAIDIFSSSDKISILNSDYNDSRVIDYSVLIYNQNFLLVSDSKVFPPNLISFDISTDRVIWNKKFTIADCRYIFDESLYFNMLDEKFNKQNKILKLNLNNGNLLWQFDLHTLSPFTDKEGLEYNAELVNIIGVYNEVVWLYIKNRRIVGVNVANGTLMYDIDLNNALGLIKGSIEYLSYAPEGYHSIHLNEREGKIQSFAHRFYWEFDLNTLQGAIKKDFGESSSANWRISRSKFYEGDKNLYFVGAKNGESVNRAVGIFDTELCEIIWYDEPLAEKKFLFFTDVPQANATLLGVLDSEKNLRIYEKNEISHI